jgi:microcystin-dependent protein
MKKPGGYSGPFTPPSDSSAPGAWVSPTEAYSYILQGNWPPAFRPGAAAGLEAGDIIDVAATGVIDSLNADSNPVLSGSLIIASGSTLSRTTYSDLWAVTSNTFGNGDGSTTFNTIDIPPSFSYIKGATTSGLSYPGQYRASGVLPDHTHNINVATSFTNETGANGSDYRTSATTGKYTTKDNTNSGGSNEGRHQQVIHCLVTKNIPGPPVGSYVTILYPGGDFVDIESSSIIPGGYLVPSGQSVSRTYYSTLFNRIGTLYGSGDGSTTFNLPDVAGLFLRGSASSDYITLSGSQVTSSGYISDQVAKHVHTRDNVYYHVGNAGGFGGAVNLTPGTTPSSTPNIGGAETRPQNVNVAYYLVAEGDF